MRTLLVGLLLLGSFSATSFAQEKTSDYLLCNLSMKTEQDAKNCISEVFYKKHTQTYYGSTVYFASDLPTRERLLATLKKHKKNISRFLNPNFITLVESSDYIALVVDQEDMSKFYIYTIDVDGEKGKKMNSIVQVYEDWFEQSPDMFGFAPSQVLYSYTY